MSAIKFSQVVSEPNVTKVFIFRNSLSFAAKIRSIQLLIKSAASYASPRADGFFASDQNSRLLSGIHEMGPARDTFHFHIYFTLNPWLKGFFELL